MPPNPIGNGSCSLKTTCIRGPDTGKGLDGGLRSVARLTARFSRLLALLASGRVLCYGLYCPLEARYRDLTPGQ